MRKTVLAVCLISLLCLMTFSVSAENDFSVSASAASGSGSVVVDISISNNPGIAAAGFLIGYDPAVLVLEKVEATDLVSGGVLTVRTDLNPVPVDWASANNITGNGTAFKAYFRIIGGNVGDRFDITLSEFAASGYFVRREDDGTLKNIAAVLSGGSVTVTETPVTSDITTEPPAVTTEAPAVTTEAPVVTTEAPAVTTEIPAVTTGSEQSSSADSGDTSNTFLIIGAAAILVVVVILILKKHGKR